MFCVEPGKPLKDIKRVAFMDFGKKRRDFRHAVKQSLQIQPGESLEDVMATTPNLHLLDAEDIECCVEMWLTEEDKVRQIHIVYIF
jgi:hypothetical protein